VRAKHLIPLVAVEICAAVGEGQYTPSNESRVQRQPKLCRSWAMR